MKKLIAVAATALLCVVPFAHAGERVVCKIWMDDGGVVARSTAPAPGDLIGVRPDTEGLGYTTLDGIACPTDRLQTDGGILASDAGLYLTNAAGQANSDGGVAGCSLCDLRGARSITLQCNAPVTYSEKWDGGVDRWGQRGVVPATTNDTLVDFSTNPDPYRIDFRGSATSNNISLKPVTASSSLVCKIATISRNVP